MSTNINIYTYTFIYFHESERFKSQKISESFKMIFIHLYFHHFHINGFYLEAQVTSQMHDSDAKIELWMTFNCILN